MPNTNSISLAIADLISGIGKSLSLLCIAAIIWGCYSLATLVFDKLGDLTKVIADLIRTEETVNTTIAASVSSIRPDKTLITSAAALDLLWLHDSKSGNWYPLSVLERPTLVAADNQAKFTLNESLNGVVDSVCLYSVTAYFGYANEDRKSELFTNTEYKKPEILSIHPQKSHGGPGFLKECLRMNLQGNRQTFRSEIENRLKVDGAWILHMNQGLRSISSYIDRDSGNCSDANSATLCTRDFLDTYKKSISQELKDSFNNSLLGAPAQRDAAAADLLAKISANGTSEDARLIASYALSQAVQGGSLPSAPVTLDNVTQIISPSYTTDISDSDSTLYIEEENVLTANSSRTMRDSLNPVFEVTSWLNRSISEGIASEYLENELIPNMEDPQRYQFDTDSLLGSLAVTISTVFVTDVARNRWIMPDQAATYIQRDLTTILVGTSLESILAEETSQISKLRVERPEVISVDRTTQFSNGYGDKSAWKAKVPDEEYMSWAAYITREVESATWNLYSNIEPQVIRSSETLIRNHIRGEAENIVNVEFFDSGRPLFDRTETFRTFENRTSIN